MLEFDIALHRQTLTYLLCRTEHDIQCDFYLVIIFYNCDVSTLSLCQPDISLRPLDCHCNDLESCGRLWGLLRWKDYTTHGSVLPLTVLIVILPHTQYKINNFDLEPHQSMHVGSIKSKSWILNTICGKEFSLVIIFKLSARKNFPVVLHPVRTMDSFACLWIASVR